MAQYHHYVHLSGEREFVLEDYFEFAGEMGNDEVDMAVTGFTFVDCDCSGLYCACHNDLRTTVQPLVVVSDGGCRYNGKPNAFAGIGVFVGERSIYNVSELMPADANFPTAQRAELTAALRALHTAIRIKDDGWLPAVRTVVLKTDCSTITDSMIDRVRTWRNNGYLTRYGCPVVDRDLFWQLEEAAITLHLRHGVETLFWWVPREDNTDADGLARTPLDAEDCRRKGILAVREADRHTKRKRSSDEAEPNKSKRVCISTQPPPTLPPLAAPPIQWVYAPYAQPLPLLPLPAPISIPQPILPQPTLLLPWVQAPVLSSPPLPYPTTVNAAPVVTYCPPVQLGQVTPLQTAANYFSTVTQYFGWR